MSAHAVAGDNAAARRYGEQARKRAAELDEDDGEHLLEDLATIPS